MRANERRDRRIRHPVLLVASLVTLGGGAEAAGPSFDCGKVEAGSVEELVTWGYDSPEMRCQVKR